MSPGIDPKAAWEELTSKADYHGEARHLAPFDFDLLSIPQGLQPKALEDLLGTGGHDIVRRFIDHVRLPPVQVAERKNDSPMLRPYYDSALLDPKNYGKLCRVLLDAGIIEIS